MAGNRGTSSVRILTTIEAQGLPWRGEGVLVLVERGLGTLRWAAVRGEDEVLTRTLLCGETPLLYAQAEEYWCPTCEKLVALADGRENVDSAVLETLRRVSNPSPAPLASRVADLEPLLRLLEEGLYLVSWVPHVPTDGQGRPFWALSRRFARLEASKDWLFTETDLYRHATGYPAFLLPTQGLECCDGDRVDEYRMALREGTLLGGLALWTDGFLSALLDGHHRATAALLEGVPLPCLTVMRQAVVGSLDGQKSLRVWDAVVPFATLPREAVRILERPGRWVEPPRRALVLPASEGTTRERTSSPSWAELEAASFRFSDVRGVAARQVAGDLSNARVELLLARGEEAAGDLWLVLHALVAEQSPRAVELALRIGRAYLPKLWTDAFRLLATVRSPAVEDFFVEFLLRDEGSHPWLEEIANAYLAGPSAPAPAVG